jgi:hypothetical protein
MRVKDNPIDSLRWMGRSERLTKRWAKGRSSDSREHVLTIFECLFRGHLLHF